GAGAVGLAVARELAMAGREVIILDAEDAIGTHTSSRNSEVIHAGIYYPKGSLKARSCVAGRHLLYEYCASHGVPHRRCGKLIVATDANQLKELENIRAKAHANGVTDVDWIAKEEVARLEPELFCMGALHSPSTGIIDSHGSMLAYLGDAEAAGAMLALRSPLENALVNGQGFELRVAGAEPIACGTLVNCAGLRAPSVAKRIEGYPAALAPRELYANGNYYSLTRRSPFSRLIYPVPEPPGRAGARAALRHRVARPHGEPRTRAARARGTELTSAAKEETTHAEDKNACRRARLRSRLAGASANQMGHADAVPGRQL